MIKWIFSQRKIWIILFLLLGFLFLYLIVAKQYDISAAIYYSPGKYENVVRIIHQSWKSHSLPPRFTHWSSSWHKCYNTVPMDTDKLSPVPHKWTYMLWTDEENRKLLSDNYPWFLSIYDKLNRKILQIDVIRYFYLYHYGGIYADLDAECLKPFEHLLNNATVVFGAMKGQYGANLLEGYTQNSFMYSKARHPFWMLLIAHIMNNTISIPNQGPEVLTGPIALINTINKWRESHMNDSSPYNQITIYPEHLFNPISWLHRDPKVWDVCKDLNRMSDTDMIRCRDKFTNISYVVQYHSQVWRSGKIL